MLSAELVAIVKTPLLIHKSFAIAERILSSSDLIPKTLSDPFIAQFNQ
jgi:hypothetical protein